MAAGTIVLIGVLVGFLLALTVFRRRARIRNRLVSLGPVTTGWLARHGNDR